MTGSLRVQAATETAQASAVLSGPVTLVLSREAGNGHELQFEEVLRRLAAVVRRQPGHLAVAVLTPSPGGPRIYTIVSHFANRPDADAWLSSQTRAQLVAEASLHRSGDLETRYVSGLEGWLVQPGSRALVAPARWRTIVVSAVGLLPLLEAVSYLLAPRLAGLPVWVRPLISVLVVIPLMQYVVMPALSRTGQRYLYPARASEPDSGVS
ncbi:MAG: antibiotic biosynthesis monooxygenase [Streptosporangiaceae bacterium]